MIYFRGRKINIPNEKEWESWAGKKITLSDADITNHQGIRLVEMFDAVYTTALAPSYAAMFGNINPPKDRHIFYFSPRAVEIFSPMLSRFSPVDCEAPANKGVSLIFGDANSRSLLV